jgi:nitrite reductase (NO-forming)
MPRIPVPHLTLALLVTTTAVAFAACGGDDESSESGGGDDLPPSAHHVVTEDNQFDPSTIEAPAGETVSVHVQNDGDNTHTFTVDELDVSVTLDPGAAETVEVNVPDEETEFRCEFHGASGMTGTLVPQ